MCTKKIGFGDILYLLLVALTCCIVSIRLSYSTGLYYTSSHRTQSTIALSTNITIRLYTDRSDGWFDCFWI